MPEAMARNLPPFPADLRLPPEFRLAVACSWIAPDGQAGLQGARVAEICRAGLDWDAFLDQVKWHGIAVQALSVLRRCPEAGGPTRLWQALQARRKRTVVRSFMQATELIRLARLLREHKVEMLPLKGAVLSQKLYGAPDIRTSGDIDVLIRPEDYPAADRLLRKSGYRSLYTLTDRQREIFLAHAYNTVYCCEASGQVLELHWRNRFWSRDDMQALWRERQTATLLGERIEAPADAALFLYLCDHGARHRWGRLKWFSDVAMMLADSGRYDWGAVAELAGRLKMRRLVAQTGLLAHWLYGVSLPAPIMQLAVEEKVTAALGKKALAAMLEGRGGKKSLLPEGVENALYYKQVRPAIPIRSLVRELIVCPADCQLLPLPDGLFWLYVPLRPLLWFWRNNGGRVFSWLSRTIARKGSAVEG